MTMSYKFDVELATKECIKWIQNWFRVKGTDHLAVVGISGGIDSAVVAALCVEALGRDRVVGVLLPNRQQKDIQDAETIVKYLKIKSYTFNIKYPVNDIKSLLVDSDCPLSEQAITNLPARVRMTMLYAVAQSIKGHVINTCNMSETYVGYDTLWGDSTGAMSPLAYLTKTEVREMADYLTKNTPSKIPSYIIHKDPQDGLCGKTDEESFGFTYKVLDQYLRTGICEDKKVQEKIDSMHRASQFKRDMIHLDSFVWPLNSIGNQAK